MPHCNGVQIMLHRILEVGFPKTGKTGSLASLLDAGYTLRYLDFDGNSQPIEAFSKPESRSRLQVVSCMDQIKIDPTGTMRYDGTPKATVMALQALNQWPVDGSKAISWGSQD